MSRAFERNPCEKADLVSVHVLRALSLAAAPVVEAHIASCAHCRRDLASLRPVTDALACWPTDVLRPAPSLQERLAHRIAGATGAEPAVPPPSGWREAEWEEVAPGLFCKLLANDEENARVSMLVRLRPGAEYPPHTHAGVEELHLLDGELWIDERKLLPGDYNRAPAGTSDARVWSETGCTCVLIACTMDLLA